MISQNPNYWDKVESKPQTELVEGHSQSQIRERRHQSLENTRKRTHKRLTPYRKKTLSLREHKRARSSLE